jgi:hypothetical protein
VDRHAQGVCQQNLSSRRVAGCCFRLPEVIDV